MIMCMLKKLSILLVALFTSIYFNAYASKEVNTDLFIVATQSPLLQYRDNGEDKGSTVEILQAILSASQLTASVNFMPWARAYDIAKSKPNTLILSIIRTPEREQLFHWLIKVSDLARVFISLAVKPENYVSNTEQAKSKLIAVIRHSAEHNELIKKGFSDKENLYIVSNPAHMITLFIKGRVDLLYADPEVVLDYIKQHSNINIAIKYQDITAKNQRDSYIATNKNINKDVLNRLQTAALQFKKTPEYLKLLAK